jgi:peptidoglycan/LPS O-acetylase OafA/YrhL
MGTRAEIPALTGVRGIAALRVVWNHYFHWCSPYPSATAPGELDWLFGTSDFGMTLFFVLSGFVITYNYAHLDWRGDPLGSFKRFAWLRFSRLYPVLLLFLLMSLYDRPRPHQFDWWTLLHVLSVQSWAPFTLDGAVTIRSQFGLAWSISAEIGNASVCCAQWMPGFGIGS